MVSGSGFAQRKSSLNAQRLFLRGKQFTDARLAEREQIVQLFFAERGFLAAALNLDEFAGGIHHQIHVHRRRHVLGVTQIQQRPASTMPTLTAATPSR